MRQNSISVVRTRNPKLYATLLAKTPEQTKKMDLNIFRSNLSEDEFKNLILLYDQNDSAPDAVKNPLVLAVENYPFVDRNVAGLGFKNDDGETIDLGQVQKSEFFIKGTQALERQQQQNPDQPLTNPEIDRTLKNVELATQATTNGPGINDNTHNKIINSTSVIVNPTIKTQRKVTLMLYNNPKIIRHKVGLLNLAEELGHVSKACQVIGGITGLSRDTFYRYRDAVEEGGVEAL